MAFGLSFGGSKTKSSTAINKTETGTQAEDSTKSTSGTTTTSGATTSTGSSTGTQTGSTTGSQQSTQTSQQFSDSVLAGLESTLAGLFGAMPSADKLSYDAGFNPDEFIASGMEAARGQVQTAQDESLNGIFDNIGGRDDSNSMAALLANRVRSDSGAALAGARGQLTSQAQEIQRNNFQANLAGAQTQQGFLNNLLAAAKGGVSSTTGNVATAEQTAQQTAQQTQEAGTNNQTQVQNITEILASLLNSTMNTTGTEKTKGKTIGGGASLSL
jgi:hypothetical protein